MGGLPKPDRQLDRRGPEITLGDLPSQIAGARGRIRRHIDRPQLSHPCAQCADRIRPLNPFRDHRRRHPRKRCQKPPDPPVMASANDPDGARSYLGGPWLASAAFTVFREQPTSRAISEIDTPSDLRSRRISAQSSTISTCFLPGSTPARVTGKLVNFHLPHRGQYSVAVDK